MDMEAITPPSPLPRRGVQGFLAAVLAGLFAGVLSVIAISSQNSLLLSGLVLIVPVPLCLVGLGVGGGDAIVAAMVATATIMFGVNDIVMTMAIVVVYILPALLLCLLALRYRYDGDKNLYWYPAGRLLTAVAVYPVIAFGLLCLFAGNGGIEKTLHDAFAQYFEQMIAFDNDLSKADKAALIESIKAPLDMLIAVMPGLTISFWMTGMMVSAMWAQYALTANKMALRPTPCLTDLDLPYALLILLALMGLIGFFFVGPAAYFARNTFLPLSMPYFFVGISLMHLWAGKRSHKYLWLLGFYVLIMFGWPAIVVAAVGVLEPWLHLRIKINGKTKASI
ncbi:MAG: hypothetical protein WDO70_10440 [Alphaproteobacteria bacterium]